MNDAEEWEEKGATKIVIWIISSLLLWRSRKFPSVVVVFVVVVWLMRFAFRSFLSSIAVNDEIFSLSTRWGANVIDSWRLFENMKNILKLEKNAHGSEHFICKFKPLKLPVQVVMPWGSRIPSNFIMQTSFSIGNEREIFFNNSWDVYLPTFPSATCASFASILCIMEGIKESSCMLSRGRLRN